MRIWVQRGGGRAASYPVHDLWEELDWFVHHWGSRMVRRPRLAIHVLSDTGETLLRFTRPGDCKRHRWLTGRHVDYDACAYCGKKRPVSKPELKRRQRRAKQIEAAAKRAVARVLQDVWG